MSKIAAIFRCPTEDYRDIKSICDENHMDISRFVLLAIQMLVEECEEEGILPPCIDPACTKRIKGKGNRGSKKCAKKATDACSPQETGMPSAPAGEDGAQ